MNANPLILPQKTILITGCTSGLGEALFARFDCDRVAWNVQGTTNDVSINRDSGRVRFWEAKSDELWTRHLVESYERIDVLINNAGINRICAIADMEMDDMHELFQVNVVGPLMLVKNLLDAKRMPRGGIVVNISSEAAWRPMRYSQAYNVSKAAFDMSTKQMARELTKPEGITVIGIRPGKMAFTAMTKYIDEQVMATRGWTEEQARAYHYDNSVTGMLQHPRDVAQVIHDLVTNPIIHSMSGACLDLVG